MSRIRIENSLEGMLLYKAGADLDTFFNKEKMDADIERYWGAMNDEKLFIIPFWKANELANTSAPKQVAFKVTNIEDATIMKTDWLSYDLAATGAFRHEVIKDANQQVTVIVTKLVSTENEAYFVFGQDLLNLFSNAIKELRVHPKFEFITARVGRMVTGVTNVYFILGKVELHLGPAAGGATTACGVRVPPRP